MNSQFTDRHCSPDQFKLAEIWQADVQNLIFQFLLQAMSRPGKLIHIENGLHDSDIVTAIFATLTDDQVTANNFDTLINERNWSLSGCQSASPDLADYIICDGSRRCLIKPKLGCLSSPEQSATLILRIDELVSGTINSKEKNLQNHRVTLRGPGVDGVLSLLISGLHPSWLQAREEWNSQFPLGVDIFLTNKTSVLALPRTTQMEVCL